MTIDDVRLLAEGDYETLEALRAASVKKIPPGARCNYIENRGDGPQELRFTWEE